MHTSNPDFIEAFVRTCYDSGLTIKNAAELYEYIRIQDMLDTIPEFREGFDGALKEAAVFATPQQSTMSTLGTIAGAGAGLLTSKLKPFRALGGLAKGLVSGAGGLVGGFAGHRVGSNFGTPPAGDVGVSKGFIPDYMQSKLPGVAASPAPGGGDIFSTPSSFRAGVTPMSGVSPAATGAGAVTPASGVQALLAGPKAQLDGLNKSITDAQAQLAAAQGKPGLEGSLAARHIQAQLAQLNSQRDQALSASNATLGSVYQDQRHSLSSLDGALNDTTKAIADRAPRADAMDQWFRNNPQNSLWSKIWGGVTGAEGQAQDLQSQLARLRQHEAELRTQRSQVSQAVNPI